MSQPFGEDAHIGEGQGQDLLAEIEMVQRAAVDDAREMASIRVRIAAHLDAANICDRTGDGAAGIVTRISRHQASGTFPRPVTVGSVFHVTFEPNRLGLAPVLAVCDRCAMLGDTAFDVHLRFAHEIDLPAACLPD